MERSKRGKNIVVSKPLLNFEGKVSKKNWLQASNLFSEIAFLLNKAFLSYVFGLYLIIYVLFCSPKSGRSPEGCFQTVRGGIHTPPSKM